MSKSAFPYDPADVRVPDVEALVTEDDSPLVNFASEKQQRLLTESLYASWACPGGRRFLAAAHVGLFPAIHRPPLVPDVFVSLDVVAPEDWWAKRQRFDPQRLLSPDPLRVFESRGGAYELLPDAYMPRASLGLVLWTGEYEGKHAEWLRWRDTEGNLVAEGQRAEAEARRADRLAERLRALGLDPDADA